MSDTDIAAKLIEALVVGVAAVIVCSSAWRSSVGKLSIAGFLAGFLLLAAMEARESIRIDRQCKTAETAVRIARDCQERHVWNTVERVIWAWNWRFEQWWEGTQPVWSEPEE